MTLLFAGGTGVGILFWAVAQVLLQPGYCRIVPGALFPCVRGGRQPK
ncbi:hypothetical protein E3U44_12675 [Nitrosococcus wardiae]|uniref:Uncharacterized protein n=1 Tax=Nitrosococcus wardiae TaxID=1814290 RepID=A0A4P7C677_9GAMM|nr:hypothetical protein E3U44_12675 [Nitrosococcus wardiae]